MNFSKKMMASIALIFAVSTLLIVSCKKETSATSSVSTAPKQLSVFLTDDPCQFDSVMVDIRYVEVKIDTSELHMNDEHFDDQDIDENNDHMHADQYGTWDTLAITPGIYNIMKLRNGVDTLLGTANLPKGTIRKIRLTLGSNNSIVVAGVSYPLNLLHDRKNYVYIKIHKEDEDDYGNGQSSIWLDFNLCSSILHEDGQYYLKPFISPFGKHSTGSIEGKVLPLDAKATVKAYNSTDSAIAIPEVEDGEYKIRGLKEGTYNLLFTSTAGYKDSLVTNIQVHVREETKIPVMTLQK